MFTHQQINHSFSIFNSIRDSIKKRGGKLKEHHEGHGLNNPLMGKANSPSLLSIRNSVIYLFFSPFIFSFPKNDPSS